MNTPQVLLVAGIVITSFLMGRVSTKLRNMKATSLQGDDLR